MHTVGDLVGLDTDQRGLHLVDPRVEGLEIDAAELPWEHLLKSRIEELPERQAAPDEILPEPALRLVHAERGVVSDR